MSAPAADPAAPAEPVGWQAQKSAATRALIVEATVRCLVELGYAGTTTQAIAAKAGLSRGAMLHHFPAKLDVFRATADDIARARLAALAKALQERSELALYRLLEACASHARQPLSLAAAELAAVARTDPELAAAVTPAQAVYARGWHQLMRGALPAHAGPARQLDAALDTVRHAVEAMALDAAAEDGGVRPEARLGFREAGLRALLRMPAAR